LIGTQKYIEAENLKIIFNGQPLPTGAGGDFDNLFTTRRAMGGCKWQKQQE
jgi:hypothetical protein